MTVINHKESRRSSFPRAPSRGTERFPTPTRLQLIAEYRQTHPVAASDRRARLLDYLRRDPGTPSGWWPYRALAWIAADDPSLDPVTLSADLRALVRGRLALSWRGVGRDGVETFFAPIARGWSGR